MSDVGNEMRRRYLNNLDLVQQDLMPRALRGDKDARDLFGQTLTCAAKMHGVELEKPIEPSDD